MLKYEKRNSDKRQIVHYLYEAPFKTLRGNNIRRANAKLRGEFACARPLSPKLNCYVSRIPGSRSGRAPAGGKKRRRPARCDFLRVENARRAAERQENAPAATHGACQQSRGDLIDGGAGESIGLGRAESGSVGRVGAAAQRRFRGRDASDRGVTSSVAAS